MKFEVKGEDVNRYLIITLTDGTKIEIHASGRCADWGDMDYGVYINGEFEGDY